MPPADGGGAGDVGVGLFITGSHPASGRECFAYKGVGVDAKAVGRLALIGHVGPVGRLNSCRGRFTRRRAEAKVPSRALVRTFAPMGSGMRALTVQGQGLAVREIQ